MFKIISNTKQIKDNKRICTLFLIANFGCIYKTDLLYYMQSIYPSFSINHLNRIINYLMDNDYIHSALSKVRPRCKIYYIISKGWDKLDTLFDSCSEEYVRLKTLKKTTAPRTTKKLREKQAITTTVTKIFMPTELLPIETPALPGRNCLDQNESGKMVPFLLPDNNFFWLPWYQLKSDNKVQLKNNIINSLWVISEKNVSCFFIFSIQTDPQKNVRYDHTFRALTERVEDVAKTYNRDVSLIACVGTFDFKHKNEYLSALEDIVFGDGQPMFYFTKDRFGDTCEMKRDKYNFRIQNNNIQYICPYTENSCYSIAVYSSDPEDSLAKGSFIDLFESIQGG